MNYLQLESLILTETFAQQQLTLPFQNLQINGTPSNHRAPFGKGISIISRQQLTLQKIIDLPQIQAIVAKDPNGTTIMAVYIPPQQRKIQL